MPRATRLIVTLAVLSGLAEPVLADVRGFAPRTIRVTGDAIIMSRPDRVELDIGVATQSESSQDVSSQNAAKMQRVMGALRSATGRAARIDTISFSLQPEFRHSPQGEQQAIVGYSASNIVQVTLDDLGAIGSVIDAATSAGANQVHRIRFTLIDDQSVRAQALRLAAREARGKARTLAETLGLSVSGVITVEETGAPARPMYEVAMLRTAGAATPIVANAIETRAAVALTVEVQPKQSNE